VLCQTGFILLPIATTVSIGKENDKSNLNKSRVLTKCPPGKRIIVDGGFTGYADKLSGYNQFDLDIMKWV
jgi:hypothetical protein